jgi:NAD(P)-dependent dehydrogenase (short-subunit alcohol dehydrogenase family)
MLAELVGDCDILVLNAAHQVRKPWAELSPQDVAVQIGVNFTASFRLAQLLVPPMQARGWGRVVFVGSVQEWRPHPQMPIYSAMKAALSHLQGSLARQVASDGVTVNSVAPGVVETDRTAAVLADSDYRARVLSAIPADRLGTPEDCAAAVAFLCSDAAGFITGANLPVTGGGHLG